jgi:hypothetical protein
MLISTIMIIENSINTKTIKLARDKVKTCISMAISNGFYFSVQVVPLEDSNGEFPKEKDSLAWGEDFMENTLKPVVLNERALAGMKKKWEKTNPGEPFVQKKQMADILIILIIPTHVNILVFTSVPDTITYNSKGIKRMWSCVDGEKRVIYQDVIPIPEDTTVFKHRDTIQREFMAELIKQGIYTPDVEEDSTFYDWD